MALSCKRANGDVFAFQKLPLLWTGLIRKSSSSRLTKRTSESLLLSAVILPPQLILIQASQGLAMCHNTGFSCCRFPFVERQLHQERQRSGQEASSSAQAESLSRGHGPRNGQFLGLDQGVWIASGLLTAWATMIHITVFHTTLGSPQAWLLFWPMLQLHTG